MINLLYSQHAMVTDAEVDCGAVFGGNPSLCDETQDAMERLFESPASSAAEARASCRQFGADYLAVARSDPAWNDANGWVWSLPLVSADTEAGSPDRVHPGKEIAENIPAAFRVVNCGHPAKSSP
jgi:hypothetical protein